DNRTPVFTIVNGAALTKYNTVPAKSSKLQRNWLRRSGGAEDAEIDADDRLATDCGVTLDENSCATINDDEGEWSAYQGAKGTNPTLYQETPDEGVFYDTAAWNGRAKDDNKGAECAN